MALVTDITNVPFSGLNHIDALLDIGPDWNFLTGNPANTIYYTFSVASDNEQGVTGQVAFNASQQLATRTAFTYLQQLTGIKFVETNTGTTAQIHLANIDIKDFNVTGLCSWGSSYLPGPNGSLVSYTADAYVYLDNVQFAAQNLNPLPGTSGYQTLLHELGHALGLRHPFHESGEDEHVHLPSSQDNTSNTIMSYTSSGGPYSTFSPYDVAALNWLYGGDGLGGALGINSTTGGRYFTGTAGTDTLVGTAFDDVFAGMGGNDSIFGGGGNDTVILNGLRSDYTFSVNASNQLIARHAGGIVTLTDIEQLSFTDGRYQRSEVTADTVAPNAPQLVVYKNAAGYALVGGPARKPVVSGTAEANALIKVYSGDKQVGETRAEANGLWQVTLDAFADGLNYAVRATATDAAGNVSAYSASDSFHVYGVLPVAPTVSVSLNSGSNQPVFSGTGEAGNLLQLVEVNNVVEIGRTVVQADGKWQLNLAPLPNGAYTVNVGSENKAGNATGGISPSQFTINNSLNVTGTAGADRFVAAAGNSAIDGGAGIDTVVYAGAKADYTIARQVYGVAVTDKTGATGLDGLYNVERLQFSDGMKALDIDGVAGQVYRLYQSFFDRPAEALGQGYWMLRMEKGSSLLQLAKEFMQQPEFTAAYGANPTEEQFLRLLYVNILQREPDAAGYDYWLNIINDDNRAQIVVDFSEGFENKALVIGTIQNGIDYEFAPGNWGMA